MKSYDILEIATEVSWYLMQNNVLDKELNMVLFDNSPGVFFGGVKNQIILDFFL